MKKFAILTSVTVGLLILATAVPTARAGIDAKLAEKVKQIAKAIEKGDDAGAKKMAAAVAKDLGALEDIMYGFKLRSKKGLGVGSTPGVSSPDGIDLKLSAITRDGITPAELMKEAKALAEAGYDTAAIAEVALIMVPEKDANGKKVVKKQWTDLAEEMRTESLALSKAAKANDGPGVKAAAAKINNSCNNCHKIFR